jgi:hypothetical protein
MGSFIAHLQVRIEQTKSDLQSSIDRMQKAMAEKDMLGAELQGYEKALAAELRHQGLIAPESNDPISVTVIPPTDEQVNRQNGRSKAEFARQFIRDHAETGVKPDALYQGFVDAAIPISKPYVYSLVQRLGKQTAIRKRRGKWYPIPDSERAASKSEEGGLPIES